MRSAVGLWRVQMTRHPLLASVRAGVNPSLLCEVLGEGPELPYLNYLSSKYDFLRDSISLIRDVCSSDA